MMTFVKQALSLVFWMICVQVFAQYSISGVVVDTNTGERLIGATVKIKGTTKGKITDLEGRFDIGGVQSQNLTLEVTYIGYEDTEQTIVLNEKVNKMTIKLKESTTALDEVVVEGVLEGQIAAMVTMKKAANIKNVVSSEQIVTFPDLNAAEVMQRIPGITLQRDQGEGRYVQLRGTPPELTNFNINGEQIPSPEGDFRYVGLDIIPSDQIEFIEVSKVMTPDQDGDGIGGSVNVITKEAKEGPPQIRTVAASGYNNLREVPIYNLQFSYGHRYNKLGFQINASFFENNQGSDNIEYDFTKGPYFNSQSQELGEDNYFLHFEEVQLRHYDIKRTRVAVSPSLDYRFNDQSKVYLKAMTNNFTDVETRRRKIYTTDDPLTFESYLFGGIEHDTRFRTQEQRLNTLAIGGEHNIGRVVVDYQMFASTASETIPDYFEARFENPGQAIRIDFDFSDPDYPRPTFDSLGNAQATDYENYDFDEFQQETSKVKEVLLTPRLNVKIPYTIHSTSDGFFKFGGKIRSRSKERDVLNRTYGNYRPVDNGNIAGEGEPLILTEVSGDWREDNLLNQGYVLEEMPDVDLFLDHFEFNSAYYIQSRIESRGNTYNQDYEYEEDIYAAYGMVEHNLDELMILAGLRYEQTNITKNLGYRTIINGGKWIGLDTLNDTRSLSFWLPQLQLKYELTPYTNLRGAITRTYSRPNYRDIINARVDDRNEATIGNPNLDFPTATNIDFMVERYKNRTILSAGVFYKKIDDFVYQFKGLLRDSLLVDPDKPDDPIPTSEVTIAFNGEEAEVYGAEFQAQFKLNFLPGRWSNLGFYSNYTYTYSKAFIPERLFANLVEAPLVPFIAEDLIQYFEERDLKETTLPGQAQNTFNLALFYDGPRLFARVSANYQDDFLTTIGLDPDYDEYYDEAFRLDYTMNYKLSKNVTLFGDWINITNTPLRYYLGASESIVKQQEFYSWWCRVGARINL